MTDLQSQNQNAQLTDVPACPAPVRLACYLLWGALLVSLLSLIPGVRQGFWENAAGSTAFVVGFLAVVYIAMGLVFLLIRRGKNWARWLTAVLVVFGWLSLVTDLPGLLAQGALAVGLELLVTALEGYALFIVFSKEGSPWFGKRI